MSKNEIEPYDLIKKSKFQKNVKNFNIKELMMTESELKTDLIKVSSNLASYKIN